MGKALYLMKWDPWGCVRGVVEGTERDSGLDCFPLSQREDGGRDGGLRTRRGQGDKWEWSGMLRKGTGQSARMGEAGIAHAGSLAASCPSPTICLVKAEFFPTPQSKMLHPCWETGALLT